VAGVAIVPGAVLSAVAGHRLVMTVTTSGHTNRIGLGGRDVRPVVRVIPSVTLVVHGSFPVATVMP
jgi:hypothetical protein